MVEYYFVKCLFSKAVAGLNEAKSDMAMGFPTYRRRDNNNLHIESPKNEYLCQGK
jgi:hypothetical protein